jgi:hypothetical protein
MKSKATVQTAKATRAKPLTQDQKRALDEFYLKVKEETVPETLKDIQERQRNAMRVRRNAFK